MIDYTRDDFAASGRTWDIILAIKGHRSLGEYRRSLAPGGRYLAAGGQMKQVFAALLLGPLRSMGGRTMKSLVLDESRNDLPRATELFEAGKLKSVIGATYPLADASRAIADYQTGHARGKIVLTV